MATGAVKWFSEKKGYGFITAEDGIDVFVHCSAVKRDGFRSLNEGDQVEFEISHGKRGLRAVNVMILGWEKRRNVTNNHRGSGFSSDLFSLIKRAKSLMRSVFGETMLSVPRN